MGYLIGSHLGLLYIQTFERQRTAILLSLKNQEAEVTLHGTAAQEVVL
jgi:hypothetical protein